MEERVEEEREGGEREGEEDIVYTDIKERGEKSCSIE